MTFQIALCLFFESVYDHVYAKCYYYFGKASIKEHAIQSERDACVF